MEEPAFSSSSSSELSTSVVCLVISPSSWYPLPAIYTSPSCVTDPENRGASCPLASDGDTRLIERALWPAGAARATPNMPATPVSSPANKDLIMERRDWVLFEKSISQYCECEL